MVRSVPSRRDIASRDRSPGEGHPVRMQPLRRRAVLIAVTSVGWAEFSLRAHPGSLPGGEAAAWLATWTLVPSFGCAAWLFAMFPSGRIEAGWLRRLARLAGLGLAAATA